MRRLLVFVVHASSVFAACVGDDPTNADDSSANDGGSDSTTNTDGSPPGDAAPPTDGSTPTTCDLTKSFGAATPLDALNGTNNSQDLRLSNDGLSAYYSALNPDGSTTIDLFQASRGSLTADFSSPVDIDF